MKTQFEPPPIWQWLKVNWHCFVQLVKFNLKEDHRVCSESRSNYIFGQKQIEFRYYCTCGYNKGEL